MDGFKKIGPLMALGTALLWGFTSFTTTILSLIAIAAGALLYVVVIRAADFHRMLSVNVLMSGDAVFDDYDHNYPKYFMLEKARIERALGNYAVAAPIHLGSSSIPGLVGTPLLDAGVAVKAFPIPGDVQRSLRDIGYLQIGTAPHNAEGDCLWINGFPMEEHSARGQGMVLHVVTGKALPWLDNMEAFTAFLSCKDGERDCQRYADLKHRCAKEGLDMFKYKEEKKALIQEIRANADVWKAKQ